MDSRTAVLSLAALAQDSRLAIYRLLVEAGPTGLAVGEIGAGLSIAPATLSFHLKELANAGLVGARQEGRYIYYSANFARMNGLIGYLGENCCARDGTACAPGCGTPKSAPSHGRRKTRSKETP
jgi:DNA-binding transcriptional ArsR family regulator